MSASVIVVGSGVTGAMAAQTLIEAGEHVLMIDGGQRDEKYASSIPPIPFNELRQRDEMQHRYLLGDEFESFQTDTVSTGAQLTPPRRFITEKVRELLPLQSEAFSALESLAYGGLGSGWGLGCSVFSEAELHKAGLPVNDMLHAYQVAASRIGISGAYDDATPFTFRHIKGVQPPLPLDPTAAVIYQRYQANKYAFNRKGFFFGRPALALLSQDMDERKASALNDMEFYSDIGKSAWRPWLTVDKLRQHAKFQYAGGILVTEFEQHDGGVRVIGVDLRTRQPVSFNGRRLVLACGALGSARIALRSLGTPRARTPLLCNPYTYLPVIVPSRVGRSMPRHNISLCQLALYHQHSGDPADIAMGYVYSYRSLMLFRLLKKVPVSVQDAHTILRFLMSGFLIVGIHHPDTPTDCKSLWLEPDPTSVTLDKVCVSYDLTTEESRRISRRERSYASALFKAGAVPLPAMRPGHGSSIHYAGTLPYSDTERPLAIAHSGLLHGTDNVYIADGSGFTYLPAKGLTLTLMANAHLVAKRVAQAAS